MRGRLDLHHIINLKSLRFVLKMSKYATDENSINYLINLCNFSGKYVALFKLFDCNDKWSVAKIKAMIYLSFNSSCNAG